MSKQKDGGSVLPTIDSDMNTAGERYFFPSGGMSLRDYFAGQALMGLIADPSVILNDYIIPAHAKTVYKIADAMIAEREKQNEA